jgi:hypothetical protein
MIGLMNDLYSNEWSDYQNHFVPQMRLKEKIRVGSKIRRKYTEPKTPYERVLECTSIPEPRKEKLRAKHERLDPFKLKKAIETKLKRIHNILKKTDKESKAA